jgi:hypothetical protein
MGKGQVLEQGKDGIGDRLRRSRGVFFEKVRSTGTSKTFQQSREVLHSNIVRPIKISDSTNCEDLFQNRWNRFDPDPGNSMDNADRNIGLDKM